MQAAASLFLIFTAFANILSFVACWLISFAFVSKRFLRKHRWSYMSVMFLITFYLFYGIGLIQGASLLEMLMQIIVTPILYMSGYAVIATISLIIRRVVLDSELDDHSSE